MPSPKYIFDSVEPKDLQRKKEVHKQNRKAILFNSLFKDSIYDTDFFYYTEIPTDYALKHMKRS